MTLDLDKLEKLADEMTISTRKARKCVNTIMYLVVSDCPCCGIIATDMEKWDADALAAFDRETLLELIRLARLSENKPGV